MRIGSNPEKDKVIRHDGYHRIIIPVYIPELSGYFEYGFEFTKLCIESVIKTKHSKCFLTIVNNGSCSEVTNYLQKLYSDGRIDQLIHYKENVGKIDALIPVARTCEEALVTISDGDVLFKDGWIQAVEEVFVNFPEAGMVAPVPNPTFYRLHSENTLFDAFFKRLLKFQSICNEEDLKRFAESIGSLDSMYKKKSRLKYQLTVERKGATALVGCGHFVSTLRKEVFDYAPSNPSGMAYAAVADKEYIDIPNDKAGLWRLATVENYAYHIGNTIDKWIYDEFNSIQGNLTETKTILPAKRSWFGLGIKRIINRLWLNKYFRPFIFKRLGLKEGLNDY
jgi:hypothetical protein